MDTWVVAMVRVRAGRRLLLWAALAAGIAFLAVVQARYTRNFLHGPYPMTAADLDAVGDPDHTPKVYVRITGTGSVETALTREEARGRGPRRHYVLLVGDRGLLYSSSRGPLTTVEGDIRRIHPSWPAYLTGPGVPARLYPFEVADHDYYTVGGYAEIIGLVLFVLVAVPMLPRDLSYWMEPREHRVVKRLATWGDPIAQDEAVAREAKTPTFWPGPWRLTDHYAVHLGLFVFDVFRWADLLWAYKQITLNRSDLVQAKTHRAFLHWPDGRALLTGRGADLDEVLAFAAARAPWAVFDSSAETRLSFVRDRAAFVEQVAARRRAAEKAAG